MKKILSFILLSLLVISCGSDNRSTAGNEDSGQGPVNDPNTFVGQLMSGVNGFVGQTVVTDEWVKKGPRNQKCYYWQKSSLELLAIDEAAGTIEVAMKDEVDSDRDNTQACPLGRRFNLNAIRTFQINQITKQLANYIKRNIDHNIRCQKHYADCESSSLVSVEDSSLAGIPVKIFVTEYQLSDGTNLVHKVWVSKRSILDSVLQYQTKIKGREFIARRRNLVFIN